MRSLGVLVYSVLLASLAVAAPAGVAVSRAMSPATGVASTPEPSETVSMASNEPNYVEWNMTDNTGESQPIRGSLGGSIMAQSNAPMQLQNPDLMAPPTTDAGLVPNAKWPFSLSKTRLQTGGWARQQNINQMSISTSLSGVDMRLEAGAIREMHWHQSAEWAYVMSGYVQITSIDENGRNYLGTVGPGDLWYFPPGVPHSIQATNQTEGGCEFLLVFDKGDFSDDSTFLLTEWLAHVPKEVLAKNFQTSMRVFDEIPGEQLYIFPSEAPSPDAVAVDDVEGQVSLPLTFKFSEVPATPLQGGTIKIADTSNFKISKVISVTELTVEPGAMRELHWHPNEDEWTYYLSGHARVTLYAANGIANTFNYQAGDIGFVPATYGHYVENTGNDTLHYLEIFNSGRVQDISLTQWLALTPPALVKAHLQLSDEMIASLNKTKAYVVGAH